MELHDAISVLLDDGGTRIVVLVNAVAEAHQFDVGLLVLDPADELLGRHVGVADVLQHLEDGLVRATMLRPG